MVIPFLLFSFDVYLRAITIVLARRLIMLVEMNESFAGTPSLVSVFLAQGR